MKTQQKQAIFFSLLMLGGAFAAFTAAIMAFRHNPAAMIPGIIALVLYMAAFILRGITTRKQKHMNADKTATN